MLKHRQVADAVFNFIQVANSADTIEAVEDDLARRLRTFGIDNFILCQATDRSRRPTAAVLCGRSLPEWRAQYVEQRLGFKDDFVQGVYRSREPISWRRFRNDHNVTEDMIDVFDRATDHHLVDGYYLPIEQGDGSTYCVAMMSKDGIDPDERVDGALHMLGLYYSFAVLRLTGSGKNFLVPGERKPQLTRRQAECLQWVRAGKTDWEISQILGISEHTVIEHLEEARRRLDVKTRTQAVINAIHFGLIQV